MKDQSEIIQIIRDLLKDREPKTKALREINISLSRIKKNLKHSSINNEKIYKEERIKLISKQKFVEKEITEINSTLKILKSKRGDMLTSNFILDIENNDILHLLWGAYQIMSKYVPLLGDDEKRFMKHINLNLIGVVKEDYSLKPAEYDMLNKADGGMGTQKKRTMKVKCH